MAIRTTEELLNMIRDKTGDSDEDLALIEDISDTLTSLSESEAVSQLNILSFYYKLWQLLSEGAPQGEFLALFICITIKKTK